MTHASAVGDFPKSPFGRIKLAADELKGIHALILRQNSAARKRQDFSSDGRQYFAVRFPDDYRTVLKENLRLLLEAKGKSSNTLKATYLPDATKKGKKVSPRSVRNILDGTGSAPNLDMLAAIAAALDVTVWQLLTPQLNPTQLPTLALTPDERKLHQEFQRWRKRLGSDDNGASDGPAAI